MTYIFTTQLPVTSAGDSQLNYGVAFTVDTNCTSSRGRFIAGVPSLNGATVTMGLWNGAGTLIASGTATVGTADPTVWINVNWASTVSLVTGQTYTVGVLTPGNNGYAYTTAELTSAINNAPLHSVAGGGRFSYGSTLARPTTTTNTNFYADVEAIVSGDVTVTAVAATGFARAAAPVVTGNNSATVTAVAAQASAAARVPTVAITGANGNVTAVSVTATTAARAPAVTGTANPTVPTTHGTVTAAAQAPTVSGESVFSSSGPATATALARPPAVTATQNPTVVAVKATAAGSAVTPVITGGSSGAATVTAVAATASASAPAPVVAATASPTVVATSASARGLATTPAVNGTSAGDAIVVAVRAVGIATAPSPAIVGQRNATVQALVALASAQARIPVVGGIFPDTLAVSNSSVGMTVTSTAAVSPTT